jgi:aminoglycoside phosphotransferase family enzyme/predicted kinase
MSNDQSDVIAFLEARSTHGGSSVERIDTHSSIVFLAGDRAWKLKRAVKFDYLDFSTLERRRTLCEAEVRLNRRTAPALYVGVVAITRETDRSLAIGGDGAPVDWLIEMRRFEQDMLLDRLSASGQLDAGLMHPLGATIAQFHRLAQARTDHGGLAGIASVVKGNERGFEEYGRDLFDRAACVRLTRQALAEADRHGDLLDRRRVSGFVRQCHGDLHLRNIVLLDGRPTLFDAIEFNDDLSCIDTLYDLAFLLMDLWRRLLPLHANQVWNGYLAESQDLEGVSLIPLFLACRAAVRAKTSATAARFQKDATSREATETLARKYLEMAHELLHPPPACLIAIGGFSGSGKSTLGFDLAPATGRVPGAVLLRSDEVRKQLAGVAPFDRLGPAGYTPEMTRRVYQTLVTRANSIVRAGHDVIVDAVFADRSNRDDIGRVAREASVPFVGLWLDAPESLLRDRVGRRRLDVSDADEGVVGTQLARDTGVIDWRRVDASGEPKAVLAQAAKTIPSARVRE